MIRAVAEFAPWVSYQLEGIATRGEFLRTAAECVGALLPADQINWLSVDRSSGVNEIYGRGGLERPEIIDELPRLGQLHPIWMSYQQRGDTAPLRLSDLIDIRTWRSHPVYTEVFRPYGVVHQVGLLIKSHPDGSGAGWGLNRTGSDFSDDEMVTALRLQPVLMALSHASERAFGDGRPGAGAPAAPKAAAVEQAALTPRELRVLELLATGLTAGAIGHVCRISPRTVRKHLQNIYAKLGCHDRLMAVRRAAELGLLRPPARDGAASGDRTTRDYA